MSNKLPTKSKKVLKDLYKKAQKEVIDFSEKSQPKDLVDLKNFGEQIQDKQAEVNAEVIVSFLENEVIPNVTSGTGTASYSSSSTVLSAKDKEDINGLKEKVETNTTNIADLRDDLTDLQEEVDQMVLSGETPQSILTKLKTVDGTGSGLDADLLDGNHASAFAQASHSHSWGSITNTPTTMAGYGIVDGVDNAEFTVVSSSVDAIKNVQFVAGTGLVGGGNLPNNITFNVIAADSTIQVNADSLQVGTIETGNIADASVTNEKLRTSQARSVIGRSDIVSGVPSDIVAAVADGVLVNDATTGLEFTKLLPENVVQASLGDNFNKIVSINSIGSVDVGRNLVFKDDATTTTQTLLGTKTGDASNLFINGFKIYHTNNDGGGSGLDADLLDGQQGSFYTNISNQTTGTLSDALLPARLGVEGKFVGVDWNSAIENGWYKDVGTGTINRPDAGSGEFGSWMVFVHTNGTDITQTAHRTDSVFQLEDAEVYRRQFKDGIWNPWQKCLITEVESDKRYLRKTGDVMSGTLDMGLNLITNIADPINPQDAATRAYVDTIVSGFDPKSNVRVATTTNIVTLSGLQIVDGIQLVEGDRILVKDQTTASQNGIRIASAGAWIRSSDADTDVKVTSGLFVFSSEGAVGADTGWFLTTNDPIVVDTTPLQFTQFYGPAAYIAGAGLTQIGHTFNIEPGNASIVVNANSIQVGFDDSLGPVNLANSTVGFDGTSVVPARVDHRHGLPAHLTQGALNATYATTSSLVVLSSSLAAHVNDVNNPHDVTADQVSFTSAQLSSTNVQDAIIEVKVSSSLDLNAHISDTNNPHNVTTTQIGAVPTSRTISTISPLTGGGTLAGSLTLGISAATTTLPGTMSAVDKLKLNGIESGATGDQTATEILAALLTVDGSGSGLDADLLDGQEGSFYASSNSLSSHTNNTNNPHNVTAVQVGAIPVTEKGAIAGIATLDAGGKIPVSQLPATALPEVHVVADATARLALTVQEGDEAIQLDDGSHWIYDGTTWYNRPVPIIPVTSVFGRIGNVAAESNDYSANQITFTPNGSIASTDVQSAIVEARNEAASDLLSHTNNVSNPHGVTVAQIGATPATRSIAAGNGLTGGGDLSANRTINIGANVDGSITVNADDIQVGVLATDAQHGLRGGDTLHALATASAHGFMSSGDFSKLATIESGATGDQTPSEILAALLTVDGSGSGLDADLLDGNTAGYFLNTGTAAQTKTGDLTMTGNLTVPTPTLAGHAATKDYVDSKIAIGSISSWAAETLAQSNTTGSILYTSCTQKVDGDYVTLTGTITLTPTTSGVVAKVLITPPVVPTSAAMGTASAYEGAYHVGDVPTTAHCRISEGTVLNPPGMLTVCVDSISPGTHYVGFSVTYPK